MTTIIYQMLQEDRIAQLFPAQAPSHRLFYCFKKLFLFGFKTISYGFVKKTKNYLVQRFDFLVFLPIPCFPIVDKVQTIVN
jgi:hypothetical protein